MKGKENIFIHTVLILIMKKKESKEKFKYGFNN